MEEAVGFPVLCRVLDGLGSRFVVDVPTVLDDRLESKTAVGEYDRLFSLVPRHGDGEAERGDDGAGDEEQRILL